MTAPWIQKIEKEIGKRFPNLPIPKYWEKGKRIYFNARSDQGDRTFSVNLRSNPIRIENYDESFWKVKRSDIESIVAEAWQELQESLIEGEKSFSGDLIRSDEDFILSTRLLAFSIGNLTGEMVPIITVVLMSEKYLESEIYGISSGALGKLWSIGKIVASYKIDAIPTLDDSGCVKFYIFAGKIAAAIPILIRSFSEYQNTQYQELNDFTVQALGESARPSVEVIRKLVQSISYPIRNNSKSIKVGPEVLEYNAKISTQVDNNTIWVTADAQCFGKPVPIPLEDIEDWKLKQITCVSTSGTTFKAILQEISPFLADKHHEPKLITPLGPLWKGPGIPTVFDYWKLKGVSIPPDDKVANVKRNGFPLAQPCSKILSYERKFLPPAQRDQTFRSTMGELTNRIQQLPHLQACELFAPVRRDIVPCDLIKFGQENERPLILQLGLRLDNGKTVIHPTEITRDPADPYKFRGLPMSLLGRRTKKGKIQPLAGSQQFHIIYILLENWLDAPSIPVEEVHAALLAEMAQKCLSSQPPSMSKITLPVMPLSRGNETSWVTAFDQAFDQAKSELLDEIPSNAIPVVVLSSHKIGIVTRNLKYTLENCIYERVKNGELPKTLRAVQGFDFAQSNQFNKKIQKLAVSIYYNAVSNLPADATDIDLKRGVIYCSNKPIGEPYHASFTIFAGYDASGEYLQDTGVKATGAILLIMDQYGRKIDSAFVPNEQSMAGSLAPRAIREMLREIVHKMDEYKLDTMQVVLVIDGIYQRKHKENLKQVYAEMAEIREGRVPEITVLSVPKSEPSRAFWYKKAGPCNPPPGLYFDTSPTTFVLINHQVLQGRVSTQPTSYKFHERIMPDSTGKPVTITAISPEEKKLLALKLFYTSFLSPSYDSRPTRLDRMIHGAHKTSAQFHYCPASMGLIKEKI